MKLGSLFDGIGGFPYAGLQFSIKPVWASEIEPFPIRVTEHHFPNMKHLGDITKINGAEIEPVDIITFGSPCQDLSVAGKREGLAGARSGLFMDAIRIIREMRIATRGRYPRFAVWENVPGAFSSNGGEDIKVVLDEIEGLGFVVDLNVLDAQYMGVPQRRRRIFALCQSVDFIRQMMTPTSWSIITQLLTEILLCILSEQLNLYEKEPKNSVWKQRKLTVDGLQRKMRLFSIETRENFEMLLNNWVETCQIHLSEPYCSESHSEKLDTTIKAATNKNEFLTEMELEKLFGNMSKSWKELLDVLYYQGNSYITLTATKGTTNQIICGCANLLENMALLIGRLKNYCQNLYETELYISTARKVCIDYARERQAGITLFSGMEWVQCWDDYIRLHTETTEQLERHFRGQCAGEILFKPESLPGDTSKSRKEREEIAGDVGDGFKAASRIDCTRGGITGAVSSKWAKGTGGPAGDEHYNLVAVPQLYDMTHADEVIRLVEPGLPPTLNARMGTGGNQIPICIQNTTRGKSQNGLGISQDDVSYTHAVAYPEPANTLLSKSNLSHRGDTDNYVYLRYAVRRLTPLECERLQGFPDNWTNIPGASDTARYKAIGNSVAILCVMFVLDGIVRVSRRGV